MLVFRPKEELPSGLPPIACILCDNIVARYLYVAFWCKKVLQGWCIVAFVFVLCSMGWWPKEFLINLTGQVDNQELLMWWLGYWSCIFYFTEEPETDCEPPCQYEGLCIGGTCICQYGFEGAYCQDPGKRWKIDAILGNNLILYV